MVYIGYPVCLEEALRLVEIPIEGNEFNYEYTDQYVERICNKLSRYGLSFYGLDKGVYVIGLKFDDYISELTCDLDETFICMIRLKNKVKKGIREAGISLQNIRIEPDLEDDSKVMNDPEPFFVNYGYY